MRTLLFFKNGHNRAICLPRDVDFNGVSEREIIREGDSIILLLHSLKRSTLILWQSANEWGLCQAITAKQHG
jgi:virulence-associated protein VagC